MPKPNFDEMRRISDEIDAHRENKTLTYEVWADLFEQAHTAVGDFTDGLEAFLIFSSEEWMKRYAKDHPK